jgi:TolA-binding protein
MRVEVNYRIKDWSAKALLEVARALEAKGDRDRATAQYREVIQRFSDHDVAAVAKERLDDLRRGP